MSVFLFALMSAIWGGAFVATKFGVATVPPVLFSSTRFVASGLIIFTILKLTRTSLALRREDWLRTAFVALFIVGLTPGLVFWGTARLPSGLAAVINLAVVPVALLAIGMMVGTEKPRALRFLALAIGLGGLAVLFWPRISGRVAGTAEEIAGALAVAIGSVTFAAGSITARPLTLRYQSFVLSAHTALWGGLAATAMALVFEPGATRAIAGPWGFSAWMGWLYILLLGTVVAHTIYMRLMRDWGASRAGMYAFISPIIALGLGTLIFEERLSVTDVAAAATMLVAAVIAIRTPSTPPPPAPASTL